MSAKATGRKYEKLTRPDWYSVNVGIMLWCLRVKLACSPEEFGDLLTRTGDKTIVESSARDSFWGAIPDAGTLRGVNVLGRLLMKLRSEGVSEVVEPLGIVDFNLYGEPIRPVHREPQLRLGWGIT